MKKIFTPVIFVCMLFAGANAAVIEVDVVDFQFNPKNVNVVVGDVVRFHFLEGFHNATSAGAAIPAGATNINSGGLSDAIRDYDYTVGVVGLYHYFCVAHGTAAGGGMAGTITASSPLPVKLKDFSVSSSADKKPVLSWTTLTEQNVNYFSLRSSTDGSHFNEIAKVTAKGNSNTEQVYSYTDKNFSVKHRYIYYELVTSDKDGKESYSSIRLYKTAFASSVLIMQVGPNPIKRPGQLMIQFNAEKAGTMLVNVFDNSGKKVLASNMTAMPGLNNAHLHICDLVPGVYNLQFNYEGLRETKKIVVN